MSVTVIAHFSVADVEKAIAGLQANAALLEEITEDTKGGGIIHQTSWRAEASSSSSTSGKRPNSSKTSSRTTPRSRRSRNSLASPARPPLRYTTDLTRPAGCSRLLGGFGIVHFLFETA